MSYLLLKVECAYSKETGNCVRDLKAHANTKTREKGGYSIRNWHCDTFSESNTNVWYITLDGLFEDPNSVSIVVSDLLDETKGVEFVRQGRIKVLDESKEPKLADKLFGAYILSDLNLEPDSSLWADGGEDG